MECESPLDWKVKTHMLCDLFSLVGFRCKDPKIISKSGIKRKIIQRSIPENNLATILENQNDNQLIEKPEVLPDLLRKKEEIARILETASANPTLGRSEVKLVRRIKEEYRRRGGWVRIFPTEVSWALYSNLFSHPHNLSNLIIHKRLFPKTFNVYAGMICTRLDFANSNPKISEHSSNIKLSRDNSLVLHSSDFLVNILKTGTNDILLARTYLLATIHCISYEGRLGTPHWAITKNELGKIWQSLIPSVSKLSQLFLDIVKFSSPPKFFITELDNNNTSENDRRNFSGVEKQLNGNNSSITQEHRRIFDLVEEKKNIETQHQLNSDEGFSKLVESMNILEARKAFADYLDTLRKKIWNAKPSIERSSYVQYPNEKYALVDNIWEFLKTMSGFFLQPVILDLPKECPFFVRERT